MELGIVAGLYRMSSMEANTPYQNTSCKVARILISTRSRKVVCKGNSMFLAGRASLGPGSVGRDGILLLGDIDLVK